MTEAMKAVMKFAETELGMKECITTYASVNSSSANVLHFINGKAAPKHEKERRQLYDLVVVIVKNLVLSRKKFL